MSETAASAIHPRDIHDRMAKNYFGVPQNMANLLEQTLPARVCERLDLDTLHLTGETFVDDELRKYIADLVFTCSSKNGEHGTVYVLFEHKSQPAPTCAIQLLHYMLGL